MTHLKLAPQLLRDITDLVYGDYLHLPLFKNKRPKKAGIKQMLKGYILSAMKWGVFDYYYKNDQLQAFFILTQTEFAPNFPFRIGTFACKKNLTTRKWILNKFDENQIIFDPETYFDLPINYKDFLPYLEKRGFSINSVKLMGRPSVCLKNINDQEFRDHPYLIQSATQKDLKQVREIEKSEFTRSPQFGHFAANEEWLKNTLKQRIQALKDKDSFLYTIKNKRKKVVGYFGARTSITPNFGPLSGPELIFDQSIQKKGLSKVAYHTLMNDLTLAKVDFIMGNTSQIPVMKNALKMGREPISFFLRFHKGYFSREYFLKNLNV